jgi:hypothetical protein
MAYTYFFFQPLRLPLAPEELDEAAIAPLTGDSSIGALERAVSGIDWQADGQGRGEIDGQWVEFHVPAAEGTLSMRCSLRADYKPIVQRLCDELGWVAFDEEPLCYQPGRPPMAA